MRRCCDILADVERAQVDEKALGKRSDTFLRVKPAVLLLARAGVFGVFAYFRQSRCGMEKCVGLATVRCGF